MKMRFMTLRSMAIWASCSWSSLAYCQMASRAIAPYKYRRKSSTAAVLSSAAVQTWNAVRVEYTSVVLRHCTTSLYYSSYAKYYANILLVSSVLSSFLSFSFVVGLICEIRYTVYRVYTVYSVYCVYSVPDVFILFKSLGTYSTHYNCNHRSTAGLRFKVYSGGTVFHLIVLHI